MEPGGSSVGRGKPRVGLALQGGGAHGAYGWGVLERLLDEDIEIVAVSGASAGALNGAALVSGMAIDGRAGGLAALERLWREVSDASPLQAFDLDWWGGPLFEFWFRRSLEAGKAFGGALARATPEVRDMRALRRIAGASIDLAALTRPGAIPLYVSATKVADGTARLFDNSLIDTDVLMASTCLPDLFSAVEIEGEAYWDGGFSANPALDPLIFAGHGATDVLIVQLTPFVDEDVPSSSAGIMARISDIGFNACLIRDLSGLTRAQTIARESPQASPTMRALAEVNLHLIEPSEALGRRDRTSKIDTRWSQLERLRGLGREAADRWLASREAD